MKRFVVLLILLFWASLCLFARGSKETNDFIGVIFYREDDVFISEVRAEIEQISTSEYPLNIVTSNNSQITQNAQVDETEKSEYTTVGNCKIYIHDEANLMT